MCGIAGWLSKSSDIENPVQTINYMLKRIAHRGPDGMGIERIANGMFGHRRLAIIDPPGGKQPLWSWDRRCVLIFNGEIYNFREIRSQLSAAGVRWQTNSDSEVLLELLRHEGPRSLSRVRGMYAFAYWDTIDRRAILARDPLGVKPLFIRREFETIWFASEAKAIPPSRSWTPSLDPARLHHLLNLRYSAEGAGLFKDVEQLQPGHILEWQDGKLRESTIPKEDPDSIRPTSIHEALTSTIREHLVADVQIGAYLSGGIDSAIITHEASIASGAPIPTFTINAGDDPSEGANASISSSLLSVPNHRASLEPIDTKAMTWLLWHLEIPKVNSIQSAAVAQLASKHVKVCLSGLGGDELFYGYRAHRIYDLLTTKLGERLCQIVSPFIHVSDRRMTAYTETSRFLTMMTHCHDQPLAYGLLRNVWDNSIPKEKIYGPRMLDADLPSVSDWVRLRWPKGPSPLRNMARFEWENKMVDDLLWQEDRTSMASGLEVRVPFVSDTVKSVADSVADISTRSAGKKQALKEAFSHLPSEILSRKKSGFQLDIATNVDALFGEVIHSWLSPERVKNHALFNPQFVLSLQRLPRRKAYRWHFFMLLLMAQSHRWLELFESGDVSVPTKPNLARES